MFVDATKSEKGSSFSGSRRPRAAIFFTCWGMSRRTTRAGGIRRERTTRTYSADACRGAAAKSAAWQPRVGAVGHLQEAQCTCFMRFLRWLLR